MRIKQLMLMGPKLTTVACLLISLFPVQAEDQATPHGSENWFIYGGFSLFPQATSTLEKDIPLGVDGFDFGVKAGGGYFLNERIAVEASYGSVPDMYFTVIAPPPVYYVDTKLKTKFLSVGLMMKMELKSSFSVLTKLGVDRTNQKATVFVGTVDSAAPMDVLKEQNTMYGVVVSTGLEYSVRKLGRLQFLYTRNFNTEDGFENAVTVHWSTR